MRSTPKAYRNVLVLIPDASASSRSRMRWTPEAYRHTRSLCPFVLMFRMPVDAGLFLYLGGVAPAWDVMAELMLGVARIAVVAAW